MAKLHNLPKNPENDYYKAPEIATPEGYKTLESFLGLEIQMDQQPMFMPFHPPNEMTLIMRKLAANQAQFLDSEGSGDPNVGTDNGKAFADYMTAAIWTPWYNGAGLGLMKNANVTPKADVDPALLDQ